MASMVSQISSLRMVGDLLERCCPRNSGELIDRLGPFLQSQEELEDGALCLGLGRLVEGPNVYSARVVFCQEETNSVSSLISFMYEERNSRLIENKKVNWERLDPEALQGETTLIERVSNTGIRVIFKVEKEGPISSLKEVANLLKTCYFESSEDIVATSRPVLQNQKTLKNGVLSLQLKMLVQDGYAFSAQVECSQGNFPPVVNEMVDWDRIDPVALERRITLLERISETGTRVILTAKIEAPTLESCWNRIIKSYQKIQSAPPPSYLSLLLEGQPSEQPTFKLELHQGNRIYEIEVKYPNQERSHKGQSAVSMIQFNPETFLWDKTKSEINWDRLNDLAINQQEVLLQMIPFGLNDSNKQFPIGLTLIGKRIQ